MKLRPKMVMAMTGLVATLGVGVPACGGITDRDRLPAEGQLLLFVDTDAWLPRAPGDAPPADDYPALFHKLRVELFVPGESESCAECTRDFSLDRGLVASGRASVGFVPRAGVTGYRARVRLYRTGAAGETQSEARPESTIESLVALPAIENEGVREITVVLRTDDVGRPRGTLERPIEPEAGRPKDGGLVGTWQAAVRRGCGTPARDGEVCIPGGAFWMGDPSFWRPLPERLVALSPYFIDRTEVTVGAFRRANIAVATVAAPDPVTNYRAKYCTYSSSPETREGLPVNCITQPLAAKYCARQGAELPSEAQYQFVASAMRSYPFPWGTDFATCTDAIFGRNGDTDAFEPQKECIALGTGVAAPGGGALDRVRVGDAEVVDLAGNLSEWSRDTYVDEKDGCWENAALDPTCSLRPTPLLFAHRGGNWARLGGYDLSARTRGSALASALGTVQIGFRCARSP